ncbi:MAG: hypothetical protein CBB95_17265 [Alteromonas sp. TMED35]|nr:MAG: hypothetical protein CBB95_17265 [Alteromonas sp. TMED35]
MNGDKNVETAQQQGDVTVALPYISEERLNRIHRENSISMYKGLLFLLVILSIEHFFLYSLYGVADSILNLFYEDIDNGLRDIRAMEGILWVLIIIAFIQYKKHSLTVKWNTDGFSIPILFPRTLNEKEKLKLMDIMQTHECTVPYYKSVIAAGRPLNSVDLDYIKMKSKHCKNR